MEKTNSAPIWNENRDMRGHIPQKIPIVNEKGGVEIFPAYVRRP